MSAPRTPPIALRDDGMIFISTSAGTAAIALHPIEMRSLAAGLLEAAENVERAAADIASAALYKAAGGTFQ